MQAYSFGSLLAQITALRRGAFGERNAPTFGWCIIAFYPSSGIGRTYSPPAKAGGGSPPVGRARALSEGDCGSCGSRWTRLHFYQTASLAHAVGAGVSTLESPVHGVVYCHLIPPSACVNLPPAAWHRYRGGTICSTPAGGTSYFTTN